MIGIAWLTALKLFVGVWTRALHLSAQLSPTNWDRVVIGCVCLLIASVFWMLSATPSAKVGTPVELQNTQQRPEWEKGQQLQSMAQQSTSEQVLKANYSDRSNSKRAGRRAPANRHKTNYLISEAGHRVTVQVRGVVAGASVKPSELNVAAGNSGAKIAAEAALEEKVQTTPAETATNVPSIFNPDEIKASLEQFEAQIDSTSAKAEADAAPSNSLPPLLQRGLHSREDVC